MMTKCDVCGREMTTSKGCTCVEVEVNDRWYPRIKVGKPGDLAYGFHEFHRGDRCGDCGAKFGQQHHPGCDMEACPRCSGQAISCGCSYSGRIRVAYNG